MGRRYLHVLALFLCLLCTRISFGIGAVPSNGCRPGERRALLEFKHSLNDPNNRLSSWVGGDCCSWSGVICSNRTGHVIKLDLRDSSSPFPWDSNPARLGGDEVNPSLLRLKHLNYLDLSNNDFDGISIPKFIGSLSNLRYLNFSEAKFGGRIPDELGNLSNLQYLDFHRTYSYSSLYADNIRWLSRLSSLKYLDMSSVDMAGVADLFHVVTSLSSLEEARLSWCNLLSLPTSLPHHNSTSLATLDLSVNYFNSPIPDWFSNLSSLVNIDLSFGNFYGPITVFGKLPSLKVLKLGYNDFGGSIPMSIGNLCKLEWLDLSNNTITGKIDTVWESLLGRSMFSLKVLNFEWNQLSGYIPDWLGEFKNLVALELGNNLLSGSIPSSIGGLSALQTLELCNNKLNGSVPESLGQLSELVVLDLGYNQLDGLVTDTHFANLRRLKALFLSSNSLVVNMSSTWVPQFQLRNIRLESCKIGPHFPAWLLTQREFSTLDISNAGISDVMPDVFWNLSSRIYYLNISYNQISGIMPMKFPEIPIVDLSSNHFHGPLPRLNSSVKFLYLNSSVQYLYLSDNLFSGTLLPIFNKRMNRLHAIAVSGNHLSGSIPSSVCEMTTLEVLDISNNSLSGTIPKCWKESTYNLKVINFANNNLSGVIPDSMGALFWLQSLHLNNNSLHGEIPSSLRNCRWLVTLDLGENRLIGKIPTWMGDSLKSLRILRLRANKFHGSIPTELPHLPSLQVLDLSHNNLTGNIPLSFSNFTAMAMTSKTYTDMLIFNRSLQTVDYEGVGRTVNYEEQLLVATKGRLLEYTKILALVVSLDLSGNNLSGGIPEELTYLYGLQSLNLSDNHLIGQIPAKIIGMNQLQSLDLSRNLLTGTIPSSNSAFSFLSSLNLSNNNLSGRIPEGQFQTFDDLSYIANPNLCGQPLPNKCSGDVSSEIPILVGIDGIDGHGHDMLWLYLSILLGFAVGFSSFCFVLLLSKSWRITYFRFIDDTSHSLYIAIARKSNRPKRSKGCNRRH